MEMLGLAAGALHDRSRRLEFPKQQIVAADE
jgi:hypothetical protein